MRSPAELL